MQKKSITGSVRPRPSKENVQYYTVVLELGKDPVTGKRIRLNFRTNTDDRQEAEDYSHVAKDKQNIVAEKLDSLLFSAVNE